MRFHTKNRRRDHRKAYLLVETGKRREKFIYDYGFDASCVGELNQARRVLAHLPPGTREVALDPAHDARDVYQVIEDQRAQTIIKPRKNARGTQINARGRALRRRRRRPTRWQHCYGRRVITESVNSSLKRRFGERLRAKGLWNQRREFGLRMLAYNLTMLNRRRVRVTIRRKDS